MLIKFPFKILYFILFISSCSDSENEANAQVPVLNSETVEVYLLNTLNDSVSDLGVEIIDFRVKRIDLPSNLSNSVYERMRTERNRLAEELRSEGKEISREIRAIADKDKVVILAEAYKKAELLRGEGDAEAARIYAEGFSQDPEFYEFTRSIKAYVETFENKSDMMLIDANSEFLKYLNQKKISD